MAAEDIFGESIAKLRLGKHLPAFQGPNLNRVVWEKQLLVAVRLGGPVLFNRFSRQIRQLESQGHKLFLAGREFPIHATLAVVNLAKSVAEAGLDEVIKKWQGVLTKTLPEHQRLLFNRFCLSPKADLLLVKDSPQSLVSDLRQCLGELLESDPIDTKHTVQIPSWQHVTWARDYHPNVSPEAYVKWLQQQYDAVEWLPVTLPVTGIYVGSCYDFLTQKEDTKD